LLNFAKKNETKIQKFENEVIFDDFNQKDFFFQYFDLENWQIFQNKIFFFQNIRKISQVYTLRKFSNFWVGKKKFGGKILVSITKSWGKKPKHHQIFIFGFNE
jgi:hypothetical protein